jgi:hypothetical protein
MRVKLVVLPGFVAAAVAALAISTREAPAGEPPAAPAPKTLDGDPPGPDKSPVPTAKEWLGATPVALSRTSQIGASCVATRVREWLRVRCPIQTFALSLLGGSNEGLAFWIGAQAEGQPGEVQFPLRRGDKRVIQFWTQGKDREGGTVPVPSLVLQEQWTEGEPSPIVTIL